MDEISKGNNSSLPLSALRLLVPPIRLASAAAWQTIQRRVVVDYGILEEFVSTVTDFVPELLTRHQRAQLILGLRTRLILEFCQCEATANCDTVQPHLDRIESWVTEVGATNVEVLNFVDLVNSMLKDNDRREHFFQEVFPKEFGPAFDETLDTLMFLFLSRLEKFLPVQTFQQITFMLDEVSSVLEECESVFQHQELKSLLQYQKDFIQLDHNDGSLDGVCIFTALRLPSVEKTETHKIQDVILDEVLSCKPHLKKESPTLPHTTEVNDTSHSTSNVKADKTNWTSESNQPAMHFEDITRNDGNLQSEAEDTPKQCSIQLERLKTPLSAQLLPVRQNRGLRMKKILLEEIREQQEEALPSFKKATSPDWDPPKAFDSEGSGGFTTETSYMAPVSDDDSWSFYSEDSHHNSSSSSTADSWSYYSDDASSLATLLSNSAEDCSLSSYSNEDPPFTGPNNVPTTSRKPAVSGAKASTPKKIRKLQCFICREYLTTSLNKHMKTHFPTGNYACPRCDRRFKLLSSFKNHMYRTCYECSKEHVDPEKPDEATDLHKCDQCPETFRYKVSLDKHKMTHNELYCSVCRRVLRDAEMLERHKVSHTLFQCTRCEESFSQFLLLQRHFENIHKINKPFQCSHCPKTTTKLRLLILHEWKHTGHLPFQCAQCSYRFRSDADLNHHQRVHTKEKPYLCSDCGKTFSKNSNLLRHLKLIHSDFRTVKRHTCSQCDKSFKEKGALKQHQRTKHLNERFRCPCPYCGKMVAANTLTRHKLMHTGERPFKCNMPECDKFFRSNSEVKRHVLYHHSLDRPYKCDICGKGFIKQCLLNAHAKIHSGEKPFVCHICGKAFLKLYSMKRHKNLVHTILSH